RQGEIDERQQPQIHPGRQFFSPHTSLPAQAVVAAPELSRKSASCNSPTGHSSASFAMFERTIAEDDLQFTFLKGFAGKFPIDGVFE
ncbi:MAG: hypothetical protein KDH19_14180, partial [Geminicoccaceae bacterium]|nr:hypothetical protein [Geminicoccaceae bacterium]